MKYAPLGKLAARMRWLTDVLRNQVAAGGLLLDLGCGTGELARVAAADGLRVTTCGIALAMLSGAGDRDPDGVMEWVRLDPDWRTLPFPSAVFDAVLTSSVLEYVDEPGIVVAECRRVLRQGRDALCSVLHLRHPIRWLEWADAAAARLPPARTAVSRPPRLDSYLTYLRISRQRQQAGWRHAEAAMTDLHLVHDRAWSEVRSPLRLLTLRRPTFREECA